MGEANYTLSEYERLALSNRVNLSDGHARHTLSSSQREIVGRSLELFDLCLTRRQQDIETEFIHTFFKCAGQASDDGMLRTYLSFTSSSAIKMAAQYCRIRGLTVFLIEPCFDNIPHILNTEGVRVISIPEQRLRDIAFLTSRLSPTNALWIVQPNNPTGFCLDQPQFEELMASIARCRSTLLIDFCFRFYATSLKTWDQYRALQQSNVKFICFEDTGKTWSIADTKAGITVCSKDSADVIYRLHDELLLNVSPLHLLLLTEFIKDTLRRGFDAAIGHGIDTNRRLVHSLVEKGLLSHGTSSCKNVPMELLGLPAKLRSTRFWSELRNRGIDILPAHNYFWSRQKEGRTLFRIPLSRPVHELEFAIPIIEQTLLDLIEL